MNYKSDKVGGPTDINFKNAHKGGLKKLDPSLTVSLDSIKFE